MFQIGAMCNVVSAGCSSTRSPAAATAARLVCAAFQLDLCSGEILGIAGVSGNGQRELAESITGLRKVTSGHVFLEGEDVTSLAPGDLTERMLVLHPRGAHADGMIKNFTVAENMILREHHKQPFSRSGFLNLRDISSHSDELIKKFHVKTPSRDTLAKNLSGGNIQKVVLAREMSRNPRVISQHSRHAVSISARRNMCANNC